ncbi:MAG: peptidylprolyl isomerase [Pseudomonadota bacterium]
MSLSRIATAALGLALIATPVLAQDSEDDPLVATVNGKEIHHSDVMEAAQALPAQYQSQIDAIFPALVDRLVDLELITGAAADAGLADDEEVETRLASLKRDVMREIYLQRELEKRVTDETLRETYDEYLAANPPKSEVHARHILVPEEETAKEIIAELDGGADFAELAKERSTGPSSAQGGDLGYFAEGQMVPEFSTAAFALEPGTYTKEPVKTQFGWHVIKSEDQRETAPPSFEEVEPQLREEASRAEFAELIAGLRDNAEIEILTPQPEEAEAEGGAAEESAQ